MYIRTLPLAILAIFSADVGHVISHLLLGSFSADWAGLVHISLHDRVDAILPNVAVLRLFSLLRAGLFGFLCLR